MVANAYARDVSGDSKREGRVFRLTKVLGGAAQPCVSPDGETLVYVGWTVAGEELFTLPFEPEQGVALSAVDSAEPRPRVAPPALQLSDARVYTPLATLLPRNWLPFVAYDTTG